ANTAITTPPAPKIVCAGSTVAQTFSVVATGTGTLHYAWMVDGAPFNGDSSSISVDPSALSVGSHPVKVTVTSDCGSESAMTALTATPLPPCLINSPSQPPICGTTNNILTAAAGAANYAWSVSGAGWSITDGQGTNTVIYTAGTGLATFTLLVTSN